MMNMEIFPDHVPMSTHQFSFSLFITGAPGLCDTGSSPWMDTRIWSRLPERLVDRVIAFLPFPSFFRSRAVCKRWYSLLFSTAFLELYLEASPQSRWFIFFKQKSLKSYVYKSSSSNNSSSERAIVEGYLFDPKEVKWFRVCFPLIPPGFYPAASSGGLICFVSEEAGSKSILLANPLTGSLTPLPSTLKPRLFPSVGLTVTNSSIDLAVAGDDLISQYAVKNLTTESFHIDAGGFYSFWGTTAALPRLCSLESGRMVFVRGKFYCMNYSPFSILCYSVSANEWCKIQAPMRRFLRSPSLVEWQKNLVLVAAVEKSKLNVPKSLRLWAFQECGSVWVEIERMPQELYLQFSDVENGQGFTCVGCGEFVVLLIKGTDQAIMFDFDTKVWQWIPPCPYNHVVLYGEGCEMHGFGFEPRLATPASALLDQLTLPFQSLMPSSF